MGVIGSFGADAVVGEEALGISWSIFVNAFFCSVVSAMVDVVFDWGFVWILGRILRRVCASGRLTRRGDSGDRGICRCLLLSTARCMD